MIPWVRKWVSSRKQRNDNNTTVTAAPAVTIQNNATPTASSSHHTCSQSNNGGLLQHQQNQQQQQTNSKFLSNLNTLSSSSRREERHKYSKSRSPSNISPRRSKEYDSKEKIRLRILVQNGHSVNLEIAITKKLAEVKNTALIELSADSYKLPLFSTDLKQLSTKYRLSRPDSSGELRSDLQEDKTLAQLGIENNETLILSVKRNITSGPYFPETVRAPRQDEIEQATRNMPQTPRQPRKVDVNELVAQSDLQFDVRKVLISLAQESAYVIGTGPFAPRLIGMLKQKIMNKKKHQSDTIQCLVDMGFTKERAAYALKLNNGVYSSALEWLIQNQSESDVPEQEDGTMPVSLSTLSNAHASLMASKHSYNLNIVENVEALLEIVKAYSHRDIPAQAHIVAALVEMGFCEGDVREALRRTHNNQAAACEWLCGNRNPSLLELRDGLTQESPILKAILESPQIQASLSNPKIFIAYLSMLENQNALSMWLGDSDTSTIISHILRKYHEEKHMLGINQFNLSTVR